MTEANGEPTPRGHPDIDRAVDGALARAAGIGDELTRALALTQLLRTLNSWSQQVAACREQAVVDAVVSGVAPSHRYVADVVGLSRQRVSQLVAAAWNRTPSGP